MQYTINFDIYDFKFWSGAKGTIERVDELNKLDELEQLIKDIFMGRTPTDTEINDFVWFETDMIEEHLGVSLYE